MLKLLLCVLLAAGAGTATAATITADINFSEEGLLPAPGGINSGAILAKAAASEGAAGLDLTVRAQNPNGQSWDRGLSGLYTAARKTLVLPVAQIGATEGPCGGTPCQEATWYAANSAIETPEPGTLTLLGGALIAAGCLVRKKKRE